MRESALHNIQRDRIVPFIREDAWFLEAARKRSECDLIELKDRMDELDDRRLSLERELAGLLARYPRLLLKPGRGERTRAVRELAGRAMNLRRRFLQSYRLFLRDSYRRYLSPETEFPVEEEELRNLRDMLSGRFESTIEPDIRETLAMMNEFINRLNKDVDQ